jgi:hypothetical protein
MTRYDTIRYDIWHNMTWRDVMWCDMLWNDIWYDMLWYKTVCYMIWHATIRYDTIYDMIFVNCSWVATRWQQYSTHLHTNSTQNNTKQTIHRTTQKFGNSAGRAPSLPVTPWHLAYSWAKSWKNCSQGSRRVTADTMKIHKHTIRIHNNKNT